VSTLQAGRAYAKLPASDFARARWFYVETLGLSPTAEGDGFAWFECSGGSGFLVFGSTGQPSGDHDQCGWVVDDFEAAAADLRARGVVFEEFPGYEFEDGIRVGPGVKSAWFRDTEGNLLNIRSATFPWHPLRGARR